MLPCLFAAGTLINLSAYRAERTLNSIIIYLFTYVVETLFEFNNLIEFFIVKLEQIQWGQLLDKSSYIYIYIYIIYIIYILFILVYIQVYKNPRALPLEANEFCICTNVF